MHSLPAPTPNILLISKILSSRAHLSHPWTYKSSHVRFSCRKHHGDRSAFCNSSIYHCKRVDLWDDLGIGSLKVHTGKFFHWASWRSPEGSPRVRHQSWWCLPGEVAVAPQRPPHKQQEVASSADAQSVQCCFWLRDDQVMLPTVPSTPPYDRWCLPYGDGQLLLCVTIVHRVQSRHQGQSSSSLFLYTVPESVLDLVPIPIPSPCQSSWWAQDNHCKLSLRPFSHGRIIHLCAHVYPPQTVW